MGLATADRLVCLRRGQHRHPYWTAPPDQPARRSEAKERRVQALNSDPLPVLGIEARTTDVPVYLDGVGTARALNGHRAAAGRWQARRRVLHRGMDVPGITSRQDRPVTYRAL